MSFSADWLALRAPADDRARSRALIDRAAAAMAARQRPGETLRIVDLGAGTGATLRALSPHLPGPQEWLLVDADAALLAVAQASAEARAPGVRVATKVADLVADPAPWNAPPDLVTASALFDLASRAFVEALADRLAADRIAFLTFLTYDGRLALDPPHPHDAAMIDAFNAHQRGHKSFGPALGPEATDVLADGLAARGHRVETEDSPWVLERPRDDALMRAKLAGWADAARERAPGDALIDGWLADRTERVERIVVGHRDLLALPA